MKIIAEAGINHNFDIGKALEMVSVAQQVGADSIKFQTWFREDWPDLGRFQKPQWLEIFNHADRLGMHWFSTPFDLESIEFLKEMGMDTWKVPSGMATHKWFLRAIKEAAGNNPIILSTGMCHDMEIREAVGTLVRYGIGKLRKLYCVSEYPAKPSSFNLALIKFGMLGYDGISDHSQGVTVPIAATALGAKIIEKHFTLDRNLPGPDQQASLEPDEFAEMIETVRNVEQMVERRPIIEPTREELEKRDRIRRRMDLGIDAQNGDHHGYGQERHDHPGPDL